MGSSVVQKGSLKRGFELGSTRRQPHAILKEKLFKERKLGEAKAQTMDKRGSEKL